MRKILLLFGLFLAACSSGEMATSTALSTSASPKANTITCTAAYRADVVQPLLQI